MTKLSVVIPIYNVEVYLEKCIESVLYPDISDYEIILVNDGSTDGSPAIAQRYADKYPELITLISTPNGGLGHARNVGIEAAKGDYLLFVDSDDYLTENSVPEILEHIDFESDIIIFDFLIVNEHNIITNTRSGFDGEPGKLSVQSCKSLINALPNACNKICRRNLFIDNDIRFPVRVWYEDVSTMLKFYLLTEKISYINKAWYCYLMRSGSITNTSNEERNLEIIPAVDTVVDFYKAHGKHEQYETELVYLAFYHQFLTACTRVAQLNPHSPVIDELRNDFLAKYPDFEKNELVRAMPFKWKLLSKLICLKQYGPVAGIMKINNKVRGK